jgi:hypothetical protein
MAASITPVQRNQTPSHQPTQRTKTSNSQPSENTVKDKVTISSESRNKMSEAEKNSPKT